VTISEPRRTRVAASLAGSRSPLMAAPTGTPPAVRPAGPSWVVPAARPRRCWRGRSTTVPTCAPHRSLSTYPAVLDLGRQRHARCGRLWRRQRRRGRHEVPRRHGRDSLRVRFTSPARTPEPIRAASGPLAGRCSPGQPSLQTASGWQQVNFTPAVAITASDLCRVVLRAGGALLAGRVCSTRPRRSPAATTA
jgi:hypothetical protein